MSYRTKRQIHINNKVKHLNGPDILAETRRRREALRVLFDEKPPPQGSWAVVKVILAVIEVLLWSIYLDVRFWGY